MLEPAQLSLSDRLVSYFNVNGPIKSTGTRFSFSTSQPNFYSFDLSFKLESLVYQIIFSFLIILLIQYLVVKLLDSYKEAGVKYSIPFPVQAQPEWKGIILNSPNIANSNQPGIITCYDPATGYHLTDIQADTKRSIDQKIEKAREAQLVWKETSWSQRRKVLNTLSRWVCNNTEQIARVAARDTGKTVSRRGLGRLGGCKRQRGRSLA